MHMIDQDDKAKLAIEAVRRPVDPYQAPRILRKRAVVDATLQITSSQDPKNPNPIGGE